MYLSFQVPDVCAEFRLNRLKIATVRARTDRHTDTQSENIISTLHYIRLAEIINFSCHPEYGHCQLIRPKYVYLCICIS